MEPERLHRENRSANAPGTLLEIEGGRRWDSGCRTLAPPGEKGDESDPCYAKTRESGEGPSLLAGEHEEQPGLALSLASSNAHQEILPAVTVHVRGLGEVEGAYLSDPRHASDLQQGLADG